MRRLSFFLILALLIAGCSKQAGDSHDGHDHEEPTAHAEEEAGHSEDIVLTPEAAKIAGIEIGEARSMPMQGELKVTGVVTNTAQGRAVVTPPVAGKIVRLLVKVGDRVSAGQAIATLESAELAQSSAGIIAAQQFVISAQAAVREAKSGIDLANAKLRTAKAGLTRQQAFAKTGAFSQPALQAAQRELADAEADFEQGKQDQVVHEAQLERAERLFAQELISRTELEQARLEVSTDLIRQRNAEKRIQIAKQAFEREEKIVQQGLANSKEVQSAESDVRAANIEVQQAKIRHQSALAEVAGANKGVQAARASYSAQTGGSRASGGTFTVTAPIGGVITEREATVGQAVERGTEICEIENLSSVWVTAQVPEKQIGQVRMGARAMVSVTAFPRQSFSGIVQVVGSRLDAKTRTMPVQVLVENKAGLLRADMFATVALGDGATTNAVSVLKSAVIADGNRNVVYLAEDGGKYEEIAVQTGRVQGEYIEILTGLQAGAKVVTKGGFVLKSEKVKAELKGHEH